MQKRLVQDLALNRGIGRIGAARSLNAETKDHRAVSNFWPTLIAREKTVVRDKSSSPFELFG
jgi:hypothetical protein